jgi:DNA-binding NarL/FixJ family response regulator
LRSLLEKQPGLEIVAESATGPEAVRLVRQCKPDVVVLEATTANSHGVEEIRQIREASPATKVMGLSMQPDILLAADFLRAGASGYMTDTNDCEELCRAINEVAAGRTYLHPEISAQVATACAQGADDGQDGLTSRQREVLKLYASGQSTKEIAIRIGRSIKTVEMHRQNAMERLKLRTMSDLTKYAIRHGMTTVDS